MVKKVKELENSLYNFDAHDNSEKKKNAKRIKNTKKKEIKSSNKKDNNQNNRFDFSNEIVIGLSKIEEPREKKKNKQLKKKNEKKNRINNKEKVEKKKIEKKDVKKKKIKNTKKNKPEIRRGNNHNSNESIYEQDIIIQRKDTQNKKRSKKIKIINDVTTF